MRVDFQTYMPRIYDGKPFGPKDLMALEDEAGVEQFVVMPEISPHPDNAGLAKRIKNNPRMIGCAAVNPALGDEAVAEFERSVRELGFKGLRLYPMLDGYPIDGKIVQPLLEKARDLGVPVTVDGCSENCMPVQIAAAARWFPEVPIIVDVGFRPAAPPVSLGLPPPPDGLIADVARESPNIYLGLTALAAAELYLIKRILGAIGTDRLVFGSNAPSGIPFLAVGGIQLARLGDAAEKAILGGTLRRIYKLD